MAVTPSGIPRPSAADLNRLVTDACAVFLFLFAAALTVETVKLVLMDNPRLHPRLDWAMHGPLQLLALAEFATVWSLIRRRPFSLIGACATSVLVMVWLGSHGNEARTCWACVPLLVVHVVPAFRARTFLPP